ncbi:MAG: DUF3445 domain-containing protein [Pseudomonadota bacterium]
MSSSAATPDHGTRPTFSPYAGRHRSFTIAMAPLDPSEWLHVDENRDAEIAEKREIFATDPEGFRAEPGTEAAQAEVAAMVGEHLAARGVPAEPPHGVPPLMAAALCVQDDLVIMRRRNEAWHLVAAALCFPSAWSLDEKFARPMDAIHEHVPHWDKMGGRVHRIFDSLRPEQLVWRLNWAVQLGGGLRDSKPKQGPRPWDAPDATDFIRVERQTLRKLPQSGDILFTIRVFMDPFAVLAAQPDRAELASRLHARIADFSEHELRYKRLYDRRQLLLDKLAAIASA